MTVDLSADSEALGRWLTERVIGARSVRIDGFTAPKSGYSAETLMVDAVVTAADGERAERFVLRRETADPAIYPLQAPGLDVEVAIQYRAMHAIATHSTVPIAPLIGYESDPSILGAPFFVMGFVPGVIPPDTPRFSKVGFVVDEASPEQRRRMVGNALTTMAAIHAIDWRQAGLGWLDRSQDGRPRTAVQIDLYESCCHTWLGGREHPVLAAAFAWLRANDPGDDRVGITWGDARLGNMIWQDYEVVAVVDWEACALSPTEADLGWWLMYDRMSFDHLGVPRLAGYPSRDEMIEMYEGASGREVRNPHYWEVFAATRLCAIFIRIGDRLVETGLVPPEINKPVVNSATDALTALLGIETPATSSGVA